MTPTPQPNESREQHKLIVAKYKKLVAAIFAVRFYLDEPYPDDARWTPYTRFIGPRLKMLEAAITKNEDIGDLVAMGDLPEEPFYTATDLDHRVQAGIEGFAEKLRAQFPRMQDEYPVDLETGAAVETYGYEATHNQAVRQCCEALDHLLQEERKS